MLSKKAYSLPLCELLCVQRMLCDGISVDAFMDSFQIGESTSKRFLSHSFRRIIYCNALIDI